MKKIWFSIMLVLLATGICAAEVPDLVGKWTGSWSGYDEGIGYSNFAERGTSNFTITDQRDRVFNGNLTISLKNGTEFHEGFAGAIGLDNKTLNIAEFDKGYALGTVISRDEIEIIYLADGENASIAINKLHRA